MAESYSQDNRLINVTTPLGKDVLFLSGFTGQEYVGGLFEFHLDLMAPTAKVPQVKFESLLGKNMTVECDVFTAQGDKHRYINGICSRFAETGADTDYSLYRAVIVPKIWLLTKSVRNRIFQQTSVPDILKKVLTGFNVEYALQGQYEPREYCVQYMETDFDFMSRLMEEEGIYYYFKHTETEHKLVVADKTLGFLDVPGPVKVEYEVIEGGQREGFHVHEWSKMQELRSGKVTLWDHHFQLPDSSNAGSTTSNGLQAQKTTSPTVQVGTVSHDLTAGSNADYELYGYPGGYAKRFDGISKSGGEQSSELSKAQQDKVRTAQLRMETEAAASLRIQGSSNCMHFLPGHKFTLAKHENAAGDYYLLSVRHQASTGSAFRSGPSQEFTYTNSFQCLPRTLEYRPVRFTRRPQVNGLQTATVVGAQGDEIFTDKYGRVKVQFHWDREGKNDPDSSCWLRVATGVAGKNWGMIHLPRVGMEVLVDFLEGDPDTPVVVGCVYNPSMLPTYKLPDHKTRSGIRTRSTLKGTPENFNEVRFEDKKGEEQLFFHAEKDMDFRVKEEARHWVGKNEHAVVKANRNELIEGNAHAGVKGNHVVKIDGNAHLKVGMSRATKISMNEAVDAGTQIHLKAGATVVIEAGAQLSLKVGGNFIDISPAGVTIVGTMVMINSGGAAGSGGGASPGDPTAPDVADDGTKGTKLS